MLPNKTSYFGFKMTMSNARLSQHNKEDSEYSMVDSPLFTEQKDALNLQIQLQNSNESTNYEEASKNFEGTLKNNRTITNSIEDSGSSAPMPLMNKLKIPAQRNRNEDQKNKTNLSSTMVIN